MGTVKLPGSPSPGGGAPWPDPPPAIPCLVPPPSGVKGVGVGVGDGLGNEPGSVTGGLGVTSTGSDGVGTVAGGLTAGIVGVGRTGGTLTGTLGVGRDSVGTGVVDGKGSTAPPAARVLARTEVTELNVRAEAGKITAASAADVPQPASTMTKNRPVWAGPSDGLAGFTNYLLSLPERGNKISNRTRLSQWFKRQSDEIPVKTRQTRQIAQGLCWPKWRWTWSAPSGHSAT